MPVAEINGAKIFYEDVGKGFPIVLTHGLGGDLTMWSYQVPAFAKKYRVIAWDVRGHGRSEVTEDGYSIEQFVEDEFALMKHLGIERAHIAGLSMGGWISWNFALAHPEATAALVLSDSAGLLLGGTDEEHQNKKRMFKISADVAEKHGRGNTADMAVGLMFSKQFIENNQEAVEVVKKKIAADPGIGYARTVRNVFLPYWDDVPAEEVLKRLAGIEAPCLVIGGDKDLLTPLVTQQEMAKVIPGARLEVIPGCGHVACIEQAELWNRLVLDFLEDKE